MTSKRVICNLCNSGNRELIYKKKTENLKKPIKDDYLISEADSQKPKRLFKCSSCGMIFAQQDRNVAYYVDKYTDMVDTEYVQEETRACNWSSLLYYL